MNFLGCGQLHARDQGDPQILGVPHGGGTVPAGIVVCEGDHIQPLHGGHAGDVGRGHIPVAAGGEAGVDVKIVEEHVHRRACTARAASKTGSSV